MVAHHPLFHRFKALTATLGVGLGLVISALPAVAQTRILFVGNSFTHGYTAPAQNYNAAAIIDENYGQLPSSPRYEGDGAGPWGGVPGIFKKLTDEAGLNYEVHIEAINGVTLQYHYENALSVIQQVGGWDRVVLQELSTRPLPTNRSGNPSLFFDYSTRLEQAVHSVNAAAKVYLYETWARADLTYPSGQPYSGQPIETMGNDLHAGYYQALAQNTGLEAVAPVGDAWLRAIQAGVALRNPYNPTAGKFDLWSGYFHASEWGSYLSANVLFFQITGVDPRTLGAAEQAAADMGISQTQAVALQQIAYEQVSGTTPPAQYSLTVTTSGSGTVSKNPAQGPYASGSNVVLTATPGAGYQFGSWGGDASGSTNPLTVNMTSNKTITATFTPTSAGQTFYRGINVNGGAITLDGQSWVGSSGAANLQLSGTAFANQGVALSPATDATRAGMIRSSIYGRTVTAALPNTPAGTYAVYLYVWEDNYAQSFGVTLEGQTVLANYTSGAAGHWDRLGPFMAAVTDGTLNIATAGGDANLSGIEVWKQNTVNRTILTPYLTNTTQANGSAEGATTSQALTGALSASRVAHAPAQAYPNPSGDGRFQVLLPEEFQGEISYTLLSALGARLATGHLTTAPLAPALAFDFSHEMTSTGLYHLQLQSQGKQAAIRLIRP